ncbi:MAG: sulfurtransferase [Limnoraphis robusta]|uniref:3-mercaptopyruvate sulfurtransferase n=1 Tax=Limnoraphis robusta CS-951 TaxID=1637645 RepID=A0A0F5YEV9_9CYAN|nr:sulfurtransferase [Limnoraphis robusta]KKD37416.1 3-mercaptopyruvate sulfurtransferase [Limnoraphis robusta CS-951]
MTDNTFVVSASWLVNHLDDPDVVVVDCRFSLADVELGQRQYQEGHIPGAYYLDLNRDLSSPVAQHGGRHPLPEPTKLAQTLSEMGINSDTLVVAYDDSRFAFAARLWWLLRYMGHEKIALLNGGFSHWKAEGYPVNNTQSTPKLGQFIPQINPDFVVDIETVKARKDQPKVALIDSREPERYLGKTEPIDPIAGHIPGAVNYPWKQVSDEAGYVKIDQQTQRWTDLKDAEEIIVYCGSGVTACVNLWSLEMAGIHQGKLYAGSWSDWCSYLLTYSHR